MKHSGSTFILTVSYVWLNISSLEAKAEENRTTFKKKSVWCQNMWLSHIMLQYIRKRTIDKNHTFHVHLHVPSQIGCIISNYIVLWIILSTTLFCCTHNLVKNESYI
jgi:hypothetical protein